VTLSGADAAAALQRQVLSRALEAGDPGQLHLRFDAAVIQRYRALGGSQVVRTQTVGRVALSGRWSLDVGISEDGSEVHLPMQDLLDRLPEDEWQHWVDHVIVAPFSANFLKMRQTAAACIDDGETQAWES
jgi:hypothetical protein